MKDLEIRGAGNLLGGEQSGHIAGVGFDLYVRHGRRGGRRLPRARRREDAEPAEVKIELPVDAHLPHDYVPGERLRLEAYQQLAERRRTRQRRRGRAPSCSDRYGPPPAAGGQPARGRRLPHRTPARPGIARGRGAGQHVRFGPVELRESQQLRLQRLYPKTLVKAATDTILVPKPMTGSGRRAAAAGPGAARDGPGI